MDRLVVDFAGLRSLAAGTDKRVEEIERLLGDLGQRIQNLTELWEGAASEGFRRTQADWLAAAEDLQNRLAGLRDLVVTAHTNHAGAVRDNVTIWRV